MTIPSSKPGMATFDFTSFLSAPAVLDVARRAGLINPINIPVTAIPSPLSSNITPEQLTSLHRGLVGPNTNPRGLEIWESWKRAWDLWNNHYIEGRVNPEWIKKEWDRRAKEREERGPRRRKYGRGFQTSNPDPKVYRTHSGTDPPPEAPWGKKWIKDRNERVKTKTGKQLSRWVKKVIKGPAKGQKWQLKPNQPLKTTTKPIRVPVKKFYSDLSLVSVQETRATRQQPYYQIAPWGEAVQSREGFQKGENQVAPPLDDDVALPEPREVNGGIVKTRRQKFRQVEHTYWDDKTVDDKTLSWDSITAGREGETLDAPGADGEEEYTEFTKKIWEPVGEYRDSDEYILVYQTVQGPGTEVEKVGGVSPNVTVDVEEFYEEETEKYIFHWELVDWFDDPRPKPKKAKKPAKLPTPEPELKDDDEDSEPESPIEIMEDDNDVLIVNMDSSDSEDDEVIPHIEEADGSSGGFFAMKDLPHDIENSSEKVYQDHPENEWEDVLNNTVWRPRRVGEKTVKIDMDRDIDEFLDDNELIVDGGFDCSHSPFPVLRWINNYYVTNFTTLNEPGVRPLFKRNKEWDQVNGTIFNMPTKPVEPDTSYETERHSLIKTLFGEYHLHDPSAHNKDIFPLDIRRVYRLNDSAIQMPQKPEDEFGPVVALWENPVKDYRSKPTSDPWYVDPNQEKLRDNPPRRFPPREHTNKGTNLVPVDDTAWVHERVIDELGDAQYFVTNLHGGTLIINGQEIRKGQVAGPLPRFAVIETPGGQVSFWWGVGGRNWNQATTPALVRDWEVLRQIPGWAHVGLKAGEVWDWKFQDRIKREEDGEEEDDDEQWNSWKNPEPELDPEAMTDAEYGAYYGTQYMENDWHVHADQGEKYNGPYKEVPPPEIYNDQNEEMKWITATWSLLQTKANEVLDIRNSIIEPTGGSFWPGRIEEKSVIPLEKVSLEDIDMSAQVWLGDHSTTHWGHFDAVQQMSAAGKLMIMEGRKKRKGEHLVSPEDVKRRKIDLANAIKALQKAQEEQDLKAQTDADNKEVKLSTKRDEYERLASIKLLMTKENLDANSARLRHEATMKELEEGRIKINQQRAKLGKPELPSRNTALHTAQFLDAIKKAAEAKAQKEKAEQAKAQKQQEKKAQANAEKLAREEAAAKKAIKYAQDQKKRDEADKLKKLQADKAKADQKKADQAAAKKKANEEAAKRAKDGKKGDDKDDKNGGQGKPGGQGGSGGSQGKPGGGSGHSGRGHGKPGDQGNSGGDQGKPGRGSKAKKGGTKDGGDDQGGDNPSSSSEDEKTALEEQKLKDAALAKQLQQEEEDKANEAAKKAIADAELKDEMEKMRNDPQIKIWRDIEAKGGSVRVGNLIGFQERLQYAMYQSLKDYDLANGIGSSHDPRPNPGIDRQTIKDNLDARAQTAGMTARQYVKQYGGFKSVNAYIDSIVAADAPSFTAPAAITANQVYQNGLRARTRLESKTPDEIAKDKNYASAWDMQSSRLGLLDPWPKPMKNPAPYAAPGAVGRAAYEQGQKMVAQYMAEARKTWDKNHMVLIEMIGDYAAEVSVIERDVREFQPKANDPIAYEF